MGDQEKDAQQNDDRRELETLRFLFDKRMELFNVRRDHEWKIFFGAFGLIGGVVALLVTKAVRLPPDARVWWWVALGVLFVGSVFYQLGVQLRNRVDRIAMDRLHYRLCEAAGIPADDTIRVSVDAAALSARTAGSRERKALLVPRVEGWWHPTYLWAFYAQHLLLAVACVVAAFVPRWVSAEPAPTLTAEEYALLRPSISAGDPRTAVVDRWGSPAGVYVVSGTRDTILEYPAHDATVKVTIRSGRVFRVDKQYLRDPALRMVRIVY